MYNIEPGENKHPVSIMTDTKCEELAFPVLFPKGRFGYTIVNVWNRVWKAWPSVNRCYCSVKYDTESASGKHTWQALQSWRRCSEVSQNRILSVFSQCLEPIAPYSVAEQVENTVVWEFSRFQKATMNYRPKRGMNG